VFSRHYRKVKIVLGLVDSILISLAYLAAYETRFQLNSHKIFHWEFYINFPVAVLLLLISVLCYVAIGYWFDIYDKLDSAHPSTVFRDTFQQCFLGAISLVLAEYLLRLDLSRFFVLLFAVYAWMLLCLFRLNVGHVLGTIRRQLGTEHFVMVAGSGERARRIGESLERSADYGIRLIGFLDDEPGQVQLSKTYEQYPLSRLPEVLRTQVVDEVIFAVETAKLPEMEKVFLLCDVEGVRTRVLLDFFPHVNSQMYLDQLGSAHLLTFSAVPHDEMRLLIKRMTDVILAAAALVLLLPFMAVIALLIRITSRGPAIFSQQRCGLNGRRFTFYKFRSMCDNAEEMKASLVHLNQKSIAFKIREDPRLTKIGRFLRKFSIDEWPQLWNVLKGDMSLVGPRPAVPEEVEQYQAWQRRRLRMRPGLTCLWAVSGRDMLDFDTWMKLDLEYIDQWSLELDLKIMLRTIPHVVSGSGAH